MVTAAVRTVNLPRRESPWPLISIGYTSTRCVFHPTCLASRPASMPSRVPDGERRGWIVPIGGAENKENDKHILERFVRVSGGSSADIVVIPTASRLHETGPRYEKLFRDLGASRVTVMDFDTR